jgi:phage shock protein PspC (stress-responsive transcriptional regulator)
VSSVVNSEPKATSAGTVLAKRIKPLVLSEQVDLAEDVAAGVLAALDVVAGVAAAFGAGPVALRVTDIVLAVGAGAGVAAGALVTFPIRPMKGERPV